MPRLTSPDPLEHICANGGVVYVRANGDVAEEYDNVESKCISHSICCPTVEQ